MFIVQFPPSPSQPVQPRIEEIGGLSREALGGWHFPGLALLEIDPKPLESQILFLRVWESLASSWKSAPAAM